MDHHTNSITLGDDDRRLVGLWVADCAERVLPLFEAKAPGDARPREAIAGIRAFARGETPKGQLRPLFRAAYAAARAVGDPASAAAARAAGLAAASAFMHNQVTADQTKHALGPATYGALARERASNDPEAAEDEIRRAVACASTAVLAIVRRMPARGPGRGRLDALHHRLDARLRL